jgi:predicted phage baseplate assembly protein
MSPQDLNDCGCCEGVTAATPAAVGNRPGLATVAYRVGTHAQFLQGLRAALSGAGRPALARLTTRDGDDFTLALLDAWATVADVLTFYQERIANESYLRTATERRSVLQLARAIGYELQPGVAASTYLAFTLEDAVGAPGHATLEVGTKVQSVPGPGEKPQTFETAETLEARAEWNELRPLQTGPVLPVDVVTEIYLKGIDTNLRKGDAILLIDATAHPSRWDFRRVTAVSAQLAAGLTKVIWEKPLTWRTLPTEIPTVPAGFRVYALRQQASFFGYNAPDWRSMSDDVRKHYPGGDSNPEWPGFTLVAIETPPALGLAPVAAPRAPKHIYLDAVYPQVLAGSWLVLSAPDHDAEVYQAEEVAADSRTGFTLSAKTTRLKPRGANLDRFNTLVRQTVILAQSEELPLAERPLADPVTGAQIVLDREVKGLPPGKKVIVRGRLAPGGDREAELVVIRGTVTQEGLTRLELAAPLTNDYDRATVTIAANVTSATHGETVAEVLGNGDASQPHQRFILRETPLTYTSSADPSGGQTTLEVRVNDLKWEEVPTLFGRGPRERIYVTQRDDDGKTTVQFGDGRTGARPPTGVENVRAVYRKGIGREGLIQADQLTLLMTRPLGVKGVTNPMQSGGAQDPQALADARRNAPFTVLTLDRVVSLRDYEDFARAFSGVAKSHVAWTWTGHARGVFITVAGADSDPVPDDPVLKNLASALLKVGDPSVPVRVKWYREVLFRLDAEVRRDPAHLATRVLTDVTAALRDRFGFAAREFGQAVTLGEVVAVIQNVPGVAAVNVTLLYRTDQPPGKSAYLPARVPRDGSADVGLEAAELLSLDLESPGQVRVVP